MSKLAESTSRAARTKGLLLTGSGVLVVSPDGLLARLIETGTLEITFWRGVYFSCGMSLLLLLRFGRELPHKARRMRWPGGLLILLYASCNLCFIYSLTHTAVANTLLILSTTPLFAAILSWLFLREVVPRRTWLAIGLVALGIGVICSGKGILPGATLGNVAGLGAAAALAASFSVVRKYRQLELQPAFALAGFCTALLLSPWAAESTVSAQDHIYLFIMGFVMLPLANMLMFLGPKYLPTAEVSLLLLLESVCGPLWVWLVLKENPGIYTLVGGTLIVATLGVHAWLSMRTRA